MWYAVGCYIGVEEALERELEATGARVYLPRFRTDIQNGHSKKWRVVEQLLFRGYMFLDREVDLRELRHGGEAWIMRTSRGDAIPVNRGQLADLMTRQALGKFNIIVQRGSGHGPLAVVLPRVGTRVRVLALNLLGKVIRITNRYAEVALDGLRQKVLVVAAGLVPV